MEKTYSKYRSKRTLLQGFGVVGGPTLLRCGDISESIPDENSDSTDRTAEGESDEYTAFCVSVESSKRAVPRESVDRIFEVKKAGNAEEVDQPTLRRENRGRNDPRSKQLFAPPKRKNSHSKIREMLLIPASTQYE